MLLVVFAIKAALFPLYFWLPRAYGAAEAARWHQRWRMFWMSCAELFGYDGGREWLVAHYRFSKP